MYSNIICDTNKDIRFIYLFRRLEKKYESKYGTNIDQCWLVYHNSEIELWKVEKTLNQHSEYYTKMPIDNTQKAM